MSRLAARPGFDAGTAQDMIVRCSQPHTMEWKANVLRGTDMLAQDIPIIGGNLTLDSSDPVRRHLTLEVGGGEEWAPRDQNSPLVPFGQRVNLWCRVDQPGTGWFPWLKMGEYHILTHTFERPSYITTVECVDMAGAVDEYLIRAKRSFVDQTVATAITDLVNDAVPGYVYSVDASDAAGDPDRALKNYVADAGTSRWEACTEIAQRRSQEVFFNADGNLVIRHDVTDDDDDTVPANGPDIGTVSNPVAVITDGDQGNLIGLTATLSREGGCNGVQINLHSTVPKKVRKKINREPLPPLPADATPEEIVARAVEIERRAAEGPWRIEWEDAPIYKGVFEQQTGGPVAWGGLFGHLPIVIERDVKDLKKWSNGGEETWSHLQADAHRDARRILHRRRGVTRYLDMHVLPLPWLEPDDKIRVRWHEFDDDSDARLTHEAHFVQRVEFDLAGGPMVVRTRSLNTTDPG
jgi:hypothetical protein